MLINVFLVLLVASVAYFHYVQGLFSAALSLLLAIVAAVLAVGWHEPVAQWAVDLGAADQAHALALVGLFLLIYGGLRLAYDKLVGGNVRFPVLVDKIGAAAMGLVAGMLGTGVLMVAAAALPFGPRYGMYSRFPVTPDAEVTIKGNPQRGEQNQTRRYDQVDHAAFIENRSESLLLPVDQMVVGLTRALSSDSGSLSCGAPMTQVHGDYLQELFGQRLGLEPAAQHTLQPQHVKIIGLFWAAPQKQVDHEAVGMRFLKPMEPVALAREEGLLVVRVEINSAAADKDGVVRMGPGNVRLLLDVGGIRQNVFPVGTLESGRTLVLNRIDDTLFIEPGKPVDLVFRVDRQAVADNKGILAPGLILEIKRLTRVNLSAVEPELKVAPLVPPPAQGGVLRKVLPGTTQPAI